VVNWITPQGDRPLAYTVIYNTVPESNELQTISGITELTHNFSNFQVFDTPCVVAVQSMDTITGLAGNYSYTSKCYIRAVMPPGPPFVTKNDIFYGDKLFQLKWSPPLDPNGLILEYVIMLVNSTQSSEDFCAESCDQGELTTIRVRPETTSYMEVFEVSENACFCAMVQTSNSAGSAQSEWVFFWYQYVPPSAMIVTVPVTVIRTVGMVQPTTQPSTGSDDGDTPIVAIILAVVLVTVVNATVVLGLVFCKMYLPTHETNRNEKPKVYS